MYVPGMDGRTITKPTQHIDVMPTLCKLLGIEIQKGDKSVDMLGELDQYRQVLFQGIGIGPYGAPRVRAWTRSRQDGRYPTCAVCRLVPGGAWILPLRNAAAPGAARRNR